MFVAIGDVMVVRLALCNPYTNGRSLSLTHAPPPLFLCGVS